MEKEISKLLNAVAFQIGTLKEAKKRFAAQLAPEFNIFDFLRTDEMGLSRCVAALLTPTGKHGQGSVFLKSFLKHIDQKLIEQVKPETPNINWVETVLEDCQVTQEKQTKKQRRIDVYLGFRNGDGIGIENKPWAGDGDQQLSDYAAFLKEHHGNKKWLLLYLSNKEPDENSIKARDREELEKSGNFLRLDYASVIEWLEDCANHSKALVVRMFIEELAKFIRQDTNGKLDMQEENELKEIICGSKVNLESAFHIFKAINSVKQHLLEKFQKDLRSSLNAKGFDLDWDESRLEDWEGRFTGFGVTFSNSPKKQDQYLYFEFQSKELNNLIWGIRPVDKDIKKETVTWNEIHRMMSNRFNQGKTSDWWPWYSDVLENEFGHGWWHTNWRDSELPWIAIEEGVLATKIAALASEVRKLFNDEGQLQLFFGNQSTPATDHTHHE